MLEVGLAILALGGPNRYEGELSARARIRIGARAGKAASPEIALEHLLQARLIEG